MKQKRKVTPAYLDYYDKDFDFTDMKTKGNQHKLSDEYDPYHTQANNEGYEHHDTSAKPIIVEEAKEDEYATEMKDKDAESFRTKGFDTLRLPHQESYISNRSLMKSTEI